MSGYYTVTVLVKKIGALLLYSLKLLKFLKYKPDFDLKGTKDSKVWRPPKPKFDLW